MTTLLTAALLLASPQDDPKRIIELIREWDRDDAGVRQKATAELEKVGEAALPFLMRASQSGSTSQRLHADALLEKFTEEQKARHRAAPEGALGPSTAELLDEARTLGAAKLAARLGDDDRVRRRLAMYYLAHCDLPLAKDAVAAWVRVYFEDWTSAKVPEGTTLDALKKVIESADGWNAGIRYAGRLFAEIGTAADADGLLDCAMRVKGHDGARLLDGVFKLDAARTVATLDGLLASRDVEVQRMALRFFNLFAGTTFPDPARCGELAPDEMDAFNKTRAAALEKAKGWWAKNREKPRSEWR